jgi:predicted nucleotidyltransferase
VTPDYDLAGLDPAQLRAIAESGPTPLFACVSGAHLYGFESPDSDVDLRGAFVATLREALRVTPFEETITIMRDEDGLELDWVAHDVHKFVRLMPRRNGYVLEQLFSPLVVIGGPWLEELRALGEGCIIRHLYHHYRGFTATQRKLLGKPDATVKALLYAYRGLLTGIHVLRAGEIQSHLPTLLEAHPTDGVEELVARKRTGAEKATLTEADLARHLPALDRLEGTLEEAFLASELPDEATSREGLDDFVVRARLELGGR